MGCEGEEYNLEKLGCTLVLSFLNLARLYSCIILSVLSDVFVRNFLHHCGSYHLSNSCVSFVLLDLLLYSQLVYVGYVIYFIIVYLRMFSSVIS